MTSLNSQIIPLSQEEMEANFDPPQYPEREDWELVLAEMKEAILDQKFLKARLLMYSLEFKILAAKMEAYKDGYKERFFTTSFLKNPFFLFMKYWFCFLAKPSQKTNL